MNLIWEKYSFGIILIIVTLLIGFYLIFSTGVKSDSYIKIIVQDGDSLWSISEKYAQDSGMSTQEFIKLIEQTNFIYGKSLQIGEEIMVPATISTIGDN